MAPNDAHTVYEIIEIISANGVKKSEQRFDHMIIKSFLAGVLLSFSGLFLLTIGGGGAPMDHTLGPGIHKMLQAAIFPIGLVLIVGTGADLFTGNTMTLVVSTLNKKTTWLQLIISWTVSYFGNLVGCLFFQYILVYYAGLLATDPYRSYTMKFAETKGNTEWHKMFLKGIAGNWLVCLAIWLGTSARDLASKIIGIWLPIWLFIAVGFEHSIANMFTVQMGMILGANLSVGKYISAVMIPVTIGNIIGGSLFVGVTYWYLFSAKKADKDATAESGTASLQKNGPAVKQNERMV